MNITILGASAGIGYEAVKRAVESNHTVTAFSRSKIKLVNSKLIHSIQRDALKKYAVKKSIEHADAVLVTLGTGKSTKAITLYSDFAEIIVSIRKETETQVPFIFITGFGIGDSQDYVPWFVKMFLKYKMRDVYADKVKMEEVISTSDLNRMIIRPGCLKDEPLTENYRTETTLFKGMNINRINRSDVADFMLKQAENPSEMKKFVGITAN
jgi:putative NADH-flavin reductase